MKEIAVQEDRLNGQSFSGKWSYFLKKRGAKPVKVDLYREDRMEQLKRCDGLMWRWSLRNPNRIFAPLILDIVETEIGIPVYPDSSMRWSWNDKVKQYYLFRKHGIETPKTWLFWEENDALEWAAKTEFPKVFKMASGAASSNVLLVRSRRTAEKIIKRCFNKGLPNRRGLDIYRGSGARGRIKNKVGGVISKITGRSSEFDTMEKGFAYFQEYIPNTNHDYRMDHIHGKVFGSIRLNRKNGFGASGSSKENNDPSKIDNDLVRLTFDYADRLGIGCAAFDFIESGGNYKLLEMCWTSPDKPIYDCPGHWNEALDWKEGHTWPEEIQVSHFLDVVQRYSDG